MESTALITTAPVQDMHKLSNAQLKMLERIHDKQMAASMFRDAAGFGKDCLKPLIQHPAFGIVLAWLLIEQLDKHQAFGRTPELSSRSASQIATILLTTQIIDSVVPG